MLVNFNEIDGINYQAKQINWYGVEQVDEYEFVQT